MRQTLSVDQLRPPASWATYARWMDDALSVARTALATGDVPVGALVVDGDGVVLGRGVNRREVDGDPLAHAEVLALRDAAAARGSWRLDDCTLVVTLEPCVMCAGAALQARLQRIVLGAWDAKAGACGGLWDVVRDPRAAVVVEVVGGVRAEECAGLLREFFVARRGPVSTDDVSLPPQVTDR